MGWVFNRKAPCIRGFLFVVVSATFPRMKKYTQHTSSAVNRWASTGLKCALIAALSACGIAKEVYQSDVQRLRTQLDGLEAKNSDLVLQKGNLDQQLQACQLELSGLRTQGAQLDQNLANALKRIKQLEAIAAKQREVFNKLRTQLDALVKAGKLTVSIVRGQFTVQMSDKILFDSGRYAIKPEAEETLIELTRILAGLQGRRWQVAGHTDSDGTVEFNWRLSANRSRAVTLFMIENGMAAERLSFAGYGQYAPAVSNETDEDKAQNRRIEIVLIPDLEALLSPIGGT